MIGYEKLYFELAAKLADTIEDLDNLSEALKQAQQQNEIEIIDEKQQKNRRLSLGKSPVFLYD